MFRYQPAPVCLVAHTFPAATAPWAMSAAKPAPSPWHKPAPSVPGTGGLSGRPARGAGGSARPGAAGTGSGRSPAPARPRARAAPRPGGRSERHEHRPLEHRLPPRDGQGRSRCRSSPSPCPSPRPRPPRSVPPRSAPTGRRCGGSGRPVPPRGPDWRRRRLPAAAAARRGQERAGGAGQCHEPRLRWGVGAVPRAELRGPGIAESRGWGEGAGQCREGGRRPRAGSARRSPRAAGREERRGRGRRSSRAAGGSRGRAGRMAAGGEPGARRERGRAGPVRGWVGWSRFPSARQRERGLPSRGCSWAAAAGVRATP